MKKLSVNDLDCSGKKVLLRVDFNVPLNESGQISDDTRIKASLPTIQLLLDKGAAIILMSHLGRPKSKIDPKYTLRPCAEKLSSLLGRKVIFATDSIKEDAHQKSSSLKSGELLLLENLRFHPGEEDPINHPDFTKNLASLGDFYVNDAFGTAHRKHASTYEICKFFPEKSAAGLLLQKEIDALTPLISNPKHPFFAIIGGAKVSSKIDVLKSLINHVDGLFIGGAMAFTFLKAQGYSVGKSLVEDSFIDTAKEIIHSCLEQKVKLFLPSDFIAQDSLSNKIFTAKIDSFPETAKGMDIGPETITSWLSTIKHSATIFWNGPLGVFEDPSFAHGTNRLALELSKLSNFRVVGGGDSVAAIHALGIDSLFSHVSTGGGASLEFIEQGSLPGVNILSNSN